MPRRLPLILLFATALCSAADLPDRGPVPADKPGSVKSEQLPGDDKKPAGTETKQPAEQAEPVVDARQDKDKTPPPGEEGKGGKAVKDGEMTDENPAPVLTIEPENATAHTACIAELKAIGATFRESERIDDGKGCGIDKPVVVDQVLPGIKLAPEGTMRCETALELARWTKEAVLPAAKVALETEGELKAINQASSYVCRLRNNSLTGKISEHARGNAIDIASFTFKSGKTIAIEPRDEDGTLNGAFQRAVTASGCLYFATVLDPGSDEAHEDHLHFDVLERKNGYRYCR